MPLFKKANSRKRLSITSLLKSVVSKTVASGLKRINEPRFFVFLPKSARCALGSPEIYLPLLFFVAKLPGNEQSYFVTAYSLLHSL